MYAMYAMYAMYVSMSMYLYAKCPVAFFLVYWQVLAQ